jgi:acyl dehydratase
LSGSAPLLYFEDFRPGEVTEYGAYPVTKEAIVAFATKYDPQPFHLDENAAKASLLGGLAASGWHTCAILMRMNCDGFLLDAASLGAPGIEEVKWLKPVRPGDVLGVRRTIRETRASRSRPGMGLVDFLFEIVNQAGDVAMTQRNVIMFGRAGVAPEPRPEPGPRAKGDAQEGAVIAEQPEPSLDYFDDVAVGARFDLGQATLTRDQIVCFAEAFDPQPFHIDEAAAQGGPFGALAASGWQTAALWMRTYLAFYARRAAATQARGLPVPLNGPSPGFREMKWLRPVYAGDTIRYSTTVTEKRESASRPDWGLVFTKNQGVDQHGTVVFEFSGASFLQRRP